MVKVDEAVIARLKIQGTNLEIMVDSEKALKLKGGENINVEDVISVQKVFFDAKKGQLASETKIKEIFDTDDFFKVAKEIIINGEVQITAEYKNKLFEEKKKRIMHKIHTYCMDSKTGNPIPLARLELAFEEAKIKISEHKDEESQIEDIVKKLRSIIPIKMEFIELKINIPSIYAAKSFPIVKEISKIKKENWLNDGSWDCLIEIPAGMKNDVFDRLNSLTKGEIEIKVISNK
jgi:ribosome maturation protein SDO1